MSDATLAWVCTQKLANSIGYQGGKLSQLRQQAERYYRGDLFGNEIDGRSKVVSRDVAEAVDSMMPPLMKIFTAGDDIVRFEPGAKHAQDGAPPAQTMALIQRAEEQATQATQYVNWIWRQNEAFATLFTWIKSALMMKVGLVKIWWDTAESLTKETYKGLTEAELAAVLGGSDDVELLEDKSYPDPAAPPSPPPETPQGPGAAGASPGGAAPPPVPMLHDVVVQITNKDGRVKIAPVPEDEFLIDRRAISLDETPFCAHKFKTTISDLKKLFPDKGDEIDGLTSDQDAEYSMERIERFKDEDELPYRQDNPADPSMREIWVSECYIKTDYDGDGYAELRKVTMVGDLGGEVIDNVETDDHPFAALTGIPMPHKFFGMSITDQTLDIQLIKSTLIRGILDHTYNSIAPQIGAVNGQVNLDDLLNRRPGGVIRVSSPDALVDVPNPPLGPEPYQLVGYFDSVREQRTGVQRFAAGPSADALNKNAYTDTATGANIVENSSQERIELIARIFAETGIKSAFRRTLELVCKHQQKARIVRLNGRWIPMDPREWTDQMDVSVDVGLGTGSKTQQRQAVGMMLQVTQQIVQLQQGIQGPIVTGQNIYNQIKKMVELSGFKNVEPFYTDPTTMQQGQQQQPQQDPTVQAAQIKAQAEAQKAQIDAQQGAAELQMRERLGMQEIQLKREIAMAELQLKAQQLNLDFHVADHAATMKVADHHLKAQQAAQGKATGDNVVEFKGLHPDKEKQPEPKPKGPKRISFHRDPATNRIMGATMDEGDGEGSAMRPDTLPMGPEPVGGGALAHP